MLCCQFTQGVTTRNQLRDRFVVVKEYDPRPRNEDGSIRWFLYRWDDGKNGSRRLVRCRHCGSFFLIQAYRWNKFLNATGTFEDWYRVADEAQADQINADYTGKQWELRNKPTVRCKGGEVQMD